MMKPEVPRLLSGQMPRLLSGQVPGLPMPSFGLKLIRRTPRDGYSDVGSDSGEDSSGERRLVTQSGFAYDAGASPVLTALRLTGTVVPAVLRRLDFWLFFGLHMVITYAWFHDLFPGDKDTRVLWEMNWHQAKVMTAVTTFFQVFYTNQCYTRYILLYSTTKKLLVEIVHICLELRLRLHTTCPQHARLISRYTIASVLLFFQHEVLTGSRATSNCYDMDTLVLTAEERSFLDTFGDHHSLAVMGWACDVWLLAHKQADLHLTIQKSLQDKQFKALSMMRELLDTLELPIPFQYFHLLNLMVCMNILVWAYVMGACDSVGGTVIFFLCELIFLGLMELSTQLADPFGDDQVDFPILEWLEETVTRCETIMEHELRGADPRNWDKILARETKLEVGAHLFAEDYPSVGEEEEPMRVRSWVQGFTSYIQLDHDANGQPVGSPKAFVGHLDDLRLRPKDDRIDQDDGDDGDDGGGDD